MKTSGFCDRCTDTKPGAGHDHCYIVRTLDNGTERRCECPLGHEGA